MNKKFFAFVSAFLFFSTAASAQTVGGIVQRISGGSGMAIGGAVTGGTAGSVYFGGTSGALAQDNANFFWDNSNNRLGIGTATPAYPLQVIGTAGVDTLILTNPLSGASISQPADRLVTIGTDTILATDGGKIVRYSVANAVTLPAASGAGFTQGFGFTGIATGTGAATVTPAAGTINGAASFDVLAGLGCNIYSDSTNYLINNSACPQILLSRANTWTAAQTFSVAPTITGYSFTLGGALTTVGTGGLTLTTTGATNATIPVGTGTLAGLGVSQSFTATQTVAPSALTISTATFTPAFANSNNFTITLDHAACPCTVANPSGTIVAGTDLTIAITQSATGSDTIGTWGTYYKFPSGTAPTLSTTASYVDIVACHVYDATHLLCNSVIGFAP